MSRYYFDLDNGDGRTRDDEGVELPDNAGAIKEASRIVTDLARDELVECGNGRIWLTIRKSDGNVLAVASLLFDTKFIEFQPAGES
ncbi:hypothetical protein QFZ34_000670 [Phyllobacterium ifriqiyense]|uniref:DUF6894 domain-containing protein n=1 Tax=Phyllobacterium ifriqiyense TaxID=314238 RepID=A0ABU0S404_9HYPH|nr:hypothetical protein [Phyllobacterium ifriqiyense]MDQ0995493.1 hypothetical protein [Phyllobacterium ifriqiyense]